jgi:tRNA pseudouridine55 synthase
VHGVVLLDKPAGMSSNQALQTVRRLFDARKAGHTGSLDPFATGMLPLCFGEATKTAGYLLNADKSYRATACLGEATATGDTEGEVTRTMAVPAFSTSDILGALSGFEGDIEQVPPMYSALKHEGRRLYELARQGREVERPPRRVTIFSLELEGWDPPLLTFQVRCSKGTYIRTLAEDIGARLGNCAHLVSLRRLALGVFDPAAMETLEELQTRAEQGRLDEALQPVDAGLADWPLCRLERTAAERFQHGNPVSVVDAGTGRRRVYGPGACLLGLGELTSPGQLRPLRVFRLG